MAGNRYWDQAPIATMTAMPRASMQELAMAPSFKYAQEQKALDEAYQMNTAADSITAVLGDKAVVPQKFKADYDAFLADVEKNGINQRNLDAARKLKSTWTSEIKPIEMFANERAKYNDAFMKASMDQNNLILGKAPSQVTFEEYRKDPNAFQFSTIGKDKLYTYGTKAGDEWKTGQMTKTTLDEYGRLHDQKGFANPQEVATAYASDKAFAGLVEQNVQKVMQANGIPLDNQDAAHAIRTGMMNQMVGREEVSNAPSDYLKSKMGMGVGPGMVDPLEEAKSSYGAVTMTPTVKRVESPFNDLESTTAYILANPSLNDPATTKETADARVARITNNVFTTYKQLAEAGKKGKDVVAVGGGHAPMAGMKIGTEQLSDSNQKARTWLEKINNTFMASDPGGIEINPAWGDLEKSRGNEEVKRYQNILKGYSHDILNNMQSFGAHKYGEPWRAAGPDSQKIIDLWKDKSSKNQELDIVGINIDSETGQPLLKVRVSSDNSDKSKILPQQIAYIEVPSHVMDPIMTMMTSPLMLGVGEKTVGTKPADVSDADWEKYQRGHKFNVIAHAAQKAHKYTRELAPSYLQKRMELNLQ